MLDRGAKVGAVISQECHGVATNRLADSEKCVRAAPVQRTENAASTRAQVSSRADAHRIREAL
jgi:hypothetical protein